VAVAENEQRPRRPEKCSKAVFLTVAGRSGRPVVEPRESQTVIEVRNLSKYYGSRCAVDNISFTVNAGEIVGFLGPNGAGKTTTIRVLTCYHPATSGMAKVAGYDVFTQSMQVRQNVGYLPESVPLYPEMRVREYLNFRGKLRGLNPDDRRAAIARVVERCWLGDVIDRPVGQLSKGYRQRVGLADTLLHNPKVLILDEPTVGLDPTQIRETRSLLKELAREHSLMFSSHTLSEVEAVVDRILLIYGGRIIAHGTANELKSRVSDGAAMVAEVKAAEGELREAVKKLIGLRTVQTESNNGWLRVTVAASGDVREQFVALTAQKGWPIRELHERRPSLEDFFVKAVMEARQAGRETR